MIETMKGTDRLINMSVNDFFAYLNVVRLVLLGTPLLLILHIKCFGQSEKLAITNITAFTEPYTPPIEHATILISNGVPITPANPFYIRPMKLLELKTTKAVRKHIRTQISNGASGIKLWTASPTGDTIDYLDTLLIAEASSITRRKGMPLFAHPSNLALIPTLKLHLWDLRSVGLSTNHNPLTVTAIGNWRLFIKEAAWSSSEPM